MTSEELLACRKKMDEFGYCVIPRVVETLQIERIRQSILPLIELQKEPLSVVSATGYTDALASAAYLALAGMQYPSVRLVGPVLINKQPRERVRPWHQDWRWWNLEISKSQIAAQIGFIFYLRDSTVDNGCLRVLPGTHVCRAVDSIAYQRFNERLEGCADVEARQGDAVLIDARVLHGTNENQTDENREAVNLWHYVAEFDTNATPQYAPA